MKQIFNILIIVALIAVIFSIRASFSEMGKMENVQQALSSVSDNYLAVEPSAKLAAASSFLLDTSIVSGPENNKTITDTNEITFEFKGTVLPKSTKYRMNFETKVEGLTTKWQQTSNTKLTVKAEPGTHKYVFWVRAKF